MIDSHLHTGITIDASGTMEDYCKRAVELGYKYICFTNHMEMPDAVQGIFDFAMDDGDVDEEYRKFQLLKGKFNLEIGFGVELGYGKDFGDLCRDFVVRHHFDFVLGSVHHIFEGKFAAEESAKKMFSRYPTEKLYERYFKLLDKAIRSGIFDSIAHFDVVGRFAPDLDFSKYEKWVVPCIESLVQMDVAIELNTRDAPHFLPSAQILKLCFEMGVKKVTIGSDSHSPEGFGTGIKEGFALLKKVGYKEVCIFKNRQPVFIRIP